MNILGKKLKLKVVKIDDIGVFLKSKHYLNNILLPKRYVPINIKIEDYIDVFIYKDSEDRIIATSLKPYIEIGKFAFLKVKEVNKIGAFLDWGLPKDLFLPFSEQKEKVVVNKMYLVYAYIDRKSDRITASSKIDKFLVSQKNELAVNEKVEILIYEETEIGLKVIVNNKFKGIIYKNEIFREINLGQKTSGYIKKIRENDGKLDVTLLKNGFESIDSLSKKIIEKLKTHKGELKLSDNSDPESIYDILGMSKKKFKKSIGILYKSGKIIIKKNKIILV